MSKVRSFFQWLKWWASGAVRSTNPNPDHDPMLAASARHQLAGRPMEAALFRVEAGNDRRGMKKAHMSNLGPYTYDNPKHCMHCGSVPQ